jgi:hypothetical protein
LELERSLANSGDGRKWSARRSLVFILATNGVLWTVLVWGVLQLVYV